MGFKGKSSSAFDNLVIPILLIRESSPGELFG
jgi:hypothetical protein